MNILYINNSMHLGGDNKCIIKLCEEFKSKDNNIIVASKGGILEKNLKDIGIKHIKINDVMNKRIKNIVLVIKEIRSIVINEHIELIHSHHRMTTFLSKISVIGTGAKVIHTQHSCVNDKLLLNKFALNRVDVIAVSNSVKNILVNKSKLSSKRIITIYNTINNSDFGKVDESILYLKEKNKFIIAQIGRLTKLKGIHEFLEIAQNLININDNIAFVLIGDGEERVYIENFIKNNNLQKNLFVLGNKNNVLKQLDYIDILISCSHVEGLPLTPLEAFSKRVPVIATNIGGTNEEIINNVNGYLIERGNLNKFIEKILILFNNKKLLNNMGENAFEIYNKKFNLKNYVDKHKKIYEENIYGK
ncbi:glycosyltransferase family 4 protein [Clostridium perfringens]|nr:glycosyltransferase family 4 protein [Clostridium perfringens]